jgi:hypothetical protein
MKTPIDLAYDYVDSVVCNADRMDGPAPMWYGWAIREAFIAGYKAAKTPNQEDICQDSNSTK